MTALERSEPENRVTELVLSGRMGTLRPLLDSFLSAPEGAPTQEMVQEATKLLITEASYDAARQLLEFDFAWAEAAHTLQSGQYQALAEARLRTGDADGALALLRTLVSSGGDTYGNLDSAAALLEANDRYGDAMPFLQRLTANVPWEISYPVRLAEAQSKTRTGDPAPLLQASAANGNAPYVLRVLARLHASAPDLHSGELNLLASSRVSAAAARQPVYTLASPAAQGQNDLAIKAALLREAVAIAPYVPETQAVRKTLFQIYVAARNMTAARSTLGDWMATRSNSSQTYRRTAPILAEEGDTEDAEEQAKPAQAGTTPRNRKHG